MAKWLVSYKKVKEDTCSLILEIIIFPFLILKNKKIISIKINSWCLNSLSFQWGDHSVIYFINLTGHHNNHIISKLQFFTVDSFEFRVFSWYFLNVFVQIRVIFIWFFQIFYSLSFLLTHHSRKCLCDVEPWVD